jgi:hypothetical protein
VNDLAAALASGRLPNVDAVLSVRESIVMGGPAAGMRAIDVRVAGGIDLRVLPDRGFDLGPAWFRGTPLAWTSAIGESGPLDRLEGMHWGDAFGGGLMTTCGLRNVGMPSEGHGLHGTFSHLAAEDVQIDRFVEPGRAGVAASATIEDRDVPAPLRVERTIRTYAGEGRVEIGDVTANLGDVRAEAPLLYHFNFGYPLWTGTATLELRVSASVARDPASVPALDSYRVVPVVARVPERVLEHEVVADEGWGSARIVNRELEVAMTVRWRVAELPRLNQWMDPNPGMAVLGIEPANCSTRGRAHDRSEGRLPMLEPGERRETRLVVEAESLD